MIIGIPKEIKYNKNRVILTPAGTKRVGKKRSHCIRTTYGGRKQITLPVSPCVSTLEF